jgi:transcriptional antiterminator NusG
MVSMSYPEQDQQALNSEEIPSEEQEADETTESESTEAESATSPLDPQADEQAKLESIEALETDSTEAESADLDSELPDEEALEVEPAEAAVPESAQADATPESPGAEQTGPDQTIDESESLEDESEISEEAEPEEVELPEEQPTSTTETEAAPEDAGTELESFEEEASEAEEFDEDGRSWFVVHCYSGYENKVRHNLEQRIETMGMKDKIFDIVVPTEEEIEVKEGKRRTVERRVFPGYILVNMVMTEESWYVVRNTPGVTGFVGMGNTPTPLRPEEVSQIIKRMEAEAPRIKVTFKSGERVRIVDGPFNDFRGTVAEIDMERAKVRVMVNFFGRETPVELDFLQVEKT